MKIERAIEILDPEHRECYDGIDEVNEACRMGMDAVPVVRCRECENWKPYGSKAARNCGDPLERYGGCEICSGGRLESDFCSFGRTREVGE